MATWSLVLAILPAGILWAVSIGLGVVVLGRSKDGQDHGKTRVLVGFGVIGLWLVAIIVVAVVFQLRSADRDPSGAVQGGGDVLIGDLRQGDCLVDDIGDDVPRITVEVVPCDQPHFLEAYDDFDLPKGSWPGQAEVDRRAEGGCVKRFEAFVGENYDESDLDMIYVRPYEEGWSVDRTVTCLVTTGGDSRDSLEGSGGDTGA
jgi:hypothetical protein